MIIYSRFSVIYWGGFDLTNSRFVREAVDLTDCAQHYLGVDDDIQYDGSSAVEAALPVILKHKGIFSNMGLDSVELTISLYYELQCAFGFWKSELHSLSTLVNKLAIDCYSIGTAD